MEKQYSPEVKELRKKMRSVRLRLKRHTIKEPEKTLLRDQLAMLKIRYKQLVTIQKYRF